MTGSTSGDACATYKEELTPVIPRDYVDGSMILACYDSFNFVQNDREAQAGMLVLQQINANKIYNLLSFLIII